jgi:prepilin-type N-terminal cleavage/methylation domain-containing protein
MKIFPRKNNNGFSLVEMIVALAIFSLMVAFIGDFEAKVFTYSDIFRGGNTTGFNSLSVLQPMAGQIRSMSPSSLGGYPIEQAGTSTLIFYDDLHNNGIAERIRYFLSGTSTLEMGVITPTGSPLNYSTSSTSTEAISTLAQNVINTASTSIFTYYDSNYNGIASSTEPIAQPVNISSISAVRITLVLDNDVNQPLVPVTVTSVATIRTLKDNL